MSDTPSPQEAMETLDELSAAVERSPRNPEELAELVRKTSRALDGLKQHHQSPAKEQEPAPTKRGSAKKRRIWSRVAG